MRGYGDECDRCERTLPERGPKAPSSRVEAWCASPVAYASRRPAQTETVPRSESVYARWQRVHGDTDHDDACGWADGAWDDGER